MSKTVLEHAQVTLITEEPEDAVDFDGELVEQEDKNFSNIDKDKWSEILQDMDPDDFKYKM